MSLDKLVTAVSEYFIDCKATKILFTEGIIFNAERKNIPSVPRMLIVVSFCKVE